MTHLTNTFLLPLFPLIVSTEGGKSIPMPDPALADYKALFTVIPIVAVGIFQVVSPENLLLSALHCIF